MTRRTSPAGIDRWLDDGGTAAKRMDRTTRQEDPMNFVMYADNGGQFHWRLETDDGKPVAASHAAFTSGDAARQAARDVLEHAGAATGADR